MNKYFLDLGYQPLANKFLKKYKKKQNKYKLKLYFNTKNKLVSISKRIPSEKMFNNKYPYKSSMSKTMKKSFYELSKEIRLLDLTNLMEKNLKPSKEIILRNNLSIYYKDILKKLINNYFSIFAIGLFLSTIHSLQEPTYKGISLKPQISSAKIL